MKSSKFKVKSYCWNSSNPPFVVRTTAVFSLIFLLTCGFQLSAQIQEAPLTRILFIYDASNSMNGRWETGVKHKIAEKLLSQTLDSLKGAPNLELALRVYGHQKYYKHGQDCEDTKLEVPFAPDNGDKISKTLRLIDPKGTTLIAYSLEQAANDFPPYNGKVRNIIILITDGIEECDGDPCAISLALQSKGIILKPFVIGVGLDVKFAKTFDCVGTYYDAADETTFKNVINIVISQAMNTTTAQVNLLDVNGLPNETNVNMTFYNHTTGAIEYNYIHTINHKGNPDTLPLNVAVTYDMVVHTIPQVRKDSITLTAGIHNIIAAETPQGRLELKLSGNTTQYKNLQAIVRQKGKCETLNLQGFRGTERYLVGRYDLEIPTLPRIYIEDVKISQSTTTTVEIPKPGLATFLASNIGYGSLYLENNGKLEWIYNFKDNMTRETMALQPGYYRIIWRPLSAKESIFTIERSFQIKSGSSTQIKLF
ncbi:MAG: VWA domain-containing protein [Flavobacteriales bacterium]|nr:VWA domain-containing protein [Flavobacteriales bacterium]